MVMINKISKKEDYQNPRREFLVKALTAGLFVAGGSMGLLQPAMASIWGKRPAEMPKGKSIYDMKGEVWVNQSKASYDTLINPGDLIKTGNKGNIIFVVGKDAFILRDNSQLQLSGEGFLVNSMRLLTGKLLSVFGRRRATEQKHILHTTTATIGIRGTGVYAESEEDQSYLCTCYGLTDIQAENDEKSQMTIAATHHDAPKYILAEGEEGKKIVQAPFKNHTDLELMLIEELVGRKPPFGIEGSEYKSPRRSY